MNNCFSQLAFNPEAVNFGGNPNMQVAFLRKKLALADDIVKVNCDAQSLKTFMSYIVKRHDGSKRRVPRHYVSMYLL